MDQFNRGFAANNKETTLLDCSLTYQDIPISTYTKGENNNNNIVSSLVQYSRWIINLYFKVIQVLFLFC